LAKTMPMFFLTVMISSSVMPASAQQAGRDASQTAAGSAGSDAVFPGKAELLRRIALYEAAEQSAERTHPGMESMVKIYSNLAALYEDTCMYAKSEAIMRREISMLRSGPQDELADAIGHLAVLHIAIADLRQAEKDELEALRIRESVGDPVGIALSWSDLADVYVKEQHYKPALDYAQKAMAVLADNPKAEVADRITVRQTLAYALCGLKQCGQAISILKDALEMEKKAYGADSLIVGSGYFILGYAAWQNGDMEDASAWMARGTARMKVDLGWGHTVYLNAMTQYAKFLRQRGQMEAAASAEREVKMANAVVDARSLSTSSSAFATAGSR
jgi:tetratricopeptide (TPR) repeat protein